MTHGRPPRRLSLPAPLAAKLALVWDASGRPGLDVEPAALAEAESALGSSIPDVILGAMVARGHIPARFVELTRARLEHAAATFSVAVARERESALVVLENFGEWPAFSIGFRPTKVPAPPALLVWDWKSWSVWKEHPVRTLETFVEHFLGGEDAAELERPPIDLDRTPTIELLAAFVPRIAAPPPPPERWVEHAKFGRGRVLREVDGSLEIAFEHGTKRLLARFVRPA